MDILNRQQERDYNEAVSILNDEVHVNLAGEVVSKNA
jgi:hypothetical protein